MGWTVLRLMSEIRQGNIVLPDIQRSFVWGESQIYDLYDSFFRGYPIGAFLLWKAIGSEESDNVVIFHNFIQDYSKGHPFPPQTELKPNESKLFVLDGQQRLQSFYLGFEGTYEGKELYIDLLSGKHLEDEDEGVRYFVRFLNNDSLRTFKARNPERIMVRLKDFIRMPPDALKMFKQKRIPTDFGLEPPRDEYYSACELVDDVIRAVTWEGRIPVTTIDEHAATSQECKPLEEVAEIFVRVNDGGTKLSRTDLIFSLMKSRWVKASEEIESLCLDLNSKGEFEVTKDFIIRCLMIFSGRSAKYNVSQMRKSGLMREFEEIFPRARKAILSTFDFLTQKKGGGIRTWRLLSGGQRPDRGYNVVIPIALYLYLQPTQEIPESEYRRMRRFLYAAIFSRYAVRYVESRLDKLAKVIRGHVDKGHSNFPSEECISVMGEAELFKDPVELIGRPNTLDPLLNILAGGGIDFQTLLDRNAPQRDHIFPRSKLMKLGYEDEVINHYANMQLLGAINNVLKTNHDPQEAFASFDPEVLAGDDYLIPKHLLAYEKFPQFIEERSHMIKDRVSRYLSDSQISSSSLKT